MSSAPLLGLTGALQQTKQATQEHRHQDIYGGIILAQGEVLSSPIVVTARAYSHTHAGGRVHACTLLSDRAMASWVAASIPSDQRPTGLVCGIS